MRLFSEIAKQLSAEGFETARILYTVADGRGGYFQNVKRVLEFTPERIVLQGKRGAVRIEGKSLSLGKYFGGDATVLGEISCVSRVE